MDFELTLLVFAMSAKHRNFCLFRGEKRKFWASEKFNVDFFAWGLANDSAPMLFYCQNVKKYKTEFV